MDVSKAAVLGGGIVALAAEAEFSNIGLSVNLFELPGFKHIVGHD